jgi:bifunctional non-homologous end joining protein LigD
VLPHEPDLLAAYRAKRSPERTPEPFGAGGERPRVFVVQQHAARRLHWDLRLELGGVLKSWAVPKGPSLDPADKRLAVATEDHPLEYADFEGVIPRGEYGAGAMIVWDRGRWVAVEDPDAGLASGKLLFELHGYKLRGLWTLVKTKGRERDPKEWLLIKKPDAWAATPGDDLPAGSVLSGLTVEELASGESRAAAVREDLDRRRAPRREVRAGGVKLMLAELRPEPFSRAGWIFELKYDGYRMLAGKANQGAPGRPILRTRRGQDAVATFPELARALAGLPYESFLADGETVVLDEEGRPDFQRLQKRAQLTRRPDAERGAVERPATLYLFDLLAFEGFDLRELPLVERKLLLRKILPEAGPLRYADHIEERGEELFRLARERGIEGVVGKRADASYRGSRSADWIKVRAERSCDFVVVGFTLPQGSRSGFGALHLGAFAGGRLVYCGRAGSGFTQRQLGEIRERLDALARPDPPCEGSPPSGREHRWVEPRLVVEVRYTELTEEGLLRKPVFLRLRDDKPPGECLLPEARAEPAPALPSAPASSSPKRPSPPAELRFSNLDKVFWPEDGYTKGDLVAYYRAVSPWLLPYLADRPVVLDRYPDGIHGKSFFQKNAPDFAPEWLRTASLWSEDSGREIGYFVCDDEAGLLYLANLATIPLHIWSSRLATLQNPDWSILDLDPKGAPFEEVITVARALHDLCGEIGLPAVVKTSGSSGLHVLVPLGAACTYEQSRQLAELLARVTIARHAAVATVTRAVRSRGGKVYIDFLQNGFGKLLVAPYSVRPLAGAPVSTPLEWSEVRRGLDPSRFTIKTLPARLKRKKRDPVRAVLEAKPDLVSALARLAALM